MTFITGLDAQEVIDLRENLPIKTGEVVKKVLAQNNGASLVLFAVDKGEEIKKHSSPGDAMVTILSGIAKITIDETEYEVSAGESIVMPAKIPHALFAKESFQMLLVVIKSN